jgi:hypothetical protein
MSETPFAAEIKCDNCGDTATHTGYYVPEGIDIEVCSECLGVMTRYMEIRIIKRIKKLDAGK